MHKTPEDILDQEIEGLAKDSSFGDASDLGHLAMRLKSVSKKTLPEPRRRRLYMLEAAPHKSKFEGFRMLTLGASGLLLFFLVLGGLAVYMSNPSNQRLFTYKKTAERLQVNLTTDTESKTKKELALAEKRLNEARELISTHPDNPELAAAALTELAKQTEQVVAVIEKASSENAEKPSQEITSKLDTLAQGQLALLNTIAPTPATEFATQKVLSATKQIIAATSEEDPADPNILSVSINGTITAMKLDSITINTTTVMVTKDTIVQSNDELNKIVPTLTIKAMVSVIAVKKDGMLLAEKITLESPAEKEIEQQDALGPLKTDTQTVTITESVTEPPKPYEAKGTFIPEDPNPQPIN